MFKRYPRRGIPLYLYLLAFKWKIAGSIIHTVLQESLIKINSGYSAPRWPNKITSLNFDGFFLFRLAVFLAMIFFHCESKW